MSEVNQVRPCKGCNRDTRNTRMSKTDYPDTIVRTTAELCKSCERAAAKGEITHTTAPPEDPKARLAAERLAAAHKAKATLEAQRARRAASRVRVVGMGQSQVRI